MFVSLRYILALVACLLLCNLTAKECASTQEAYLKVAQMVLDDLYETNGNRIYLKPKLEIVTTTKKVASFYPRSEQIVIEERVFAICRTFGPDSLDALAFIIGHELAHAQLHRSNASHYLEYDKSINKDKRQEHEADLQGLFNAYLAGYRTFDILPDLISRIYAEYQLNDQQLAKYPSLQVRQQSVRTMQRDLKKLIQIFEGANYLTAIGEYELAAASYEYIEQRYKGREIYNNLAVNYALQAINFTEEDVDVFLYPLELDWNTRMKKPKNRMGGKDLKPKEQLYRMRLLARAEQYLQTAKKMDTQYTVTDINVMCILSLQGRFQAAIDYYDKYQLANRIRWSTNANYQQELAQLALATAYVGIKDVMAARTIWNKLKNSNFPYIAYHAQYNLKMMEQEKCSAYKDYQCRLADPNLPIVDGVVPGKVNYPAGFTIQQTDQIQLNIQKKRNSLVYQFTTPTRKFYVQRILNEGLQLPVMTARQQLKIVASTGGTLEHCPDNDYFILTNNHRGKTTEWGKYW